MSFGSLGLSLERPRLNRLKRAFMAEVVGRMRPEQADKGKRSRDGRGREGGEGRQVEAARELGKKTFRQPRGVSRPSATTCLSPFSLPRNQSHPELSHFCANLYPFTSTGRLRRSISTIYTDSPSYCLAWATAREQSNYVAVDPALSMVEVV